MTTAAATATRKINIVTAARQKALAWAAVLRASSTASAGIIGNM